MTQDGEVWQWGHRAVMPRRVHLAGSRDVTRADGTSEVYFHRGHQVRNGQTALRRLCAGFM
jgi:hypothetical protein